MARCGYLALAMTVLAGAAPAAANPRPDTVPALRVWHEGRTGDFKLRAGARVVAAKPYRKKLTPEVRRLARDLNVRAAPKRRARKGDVVLRIDRTIASRFGLEGYKLRLGPRAVVEALGNKGVFYGGRTLLQLLGKDRKAPKGRAADYPRYGERGLMIDNGRQFFSRAWLKARIKEMSNLKLNLLHLHFSDNQGFRLESETHPEIVSDPHLKKADIRSLVETARRHHVTIIPELDAPGHLQAALTNHPELQLTNAAGQKQPDKLDVTLPEARTFIADLLGEYLPLFPGPWWHTGADEYLGVASTEQDYELYPQLEAYADEKYGEAANGKDAVLDFVNFVAGIASEQNKKIRVWSDGIEGGSAVKLEPAAAVEWWENRASPPPEELMSRGHRVQNAGWWPLYYVTGGPLEGLRATEQEMYEDWEANVFEGPWSTRWGSGEPDQSARFEVARDAKNQLGAQLNIWNDDPGNMGQEKIAKGIAPRLKILAQKTWASRELTGDYEEFKRRTR